MNIDRLVTIFKAARRCRRSLILDMYAASVLRATANQNLPQAEWEGIRVYLPRSQKAAIVQHEAFDLARSFPHRIYPEDLVAQAAGSVMLFRPSMRAELEAAGCLAGAHLIYSLWEGYLKDEKQAGLLAWLAEHDISLTHCHTSGHAYAPDLVRLVAALAPRVVTPVHSEVPERFLSLFSNAVLRADGEWWEVTSNRSARCSEEAF